MTLAPTLAVRRAVFDGEPCVLKEYELGDAKEWDKLRKEVRLLCGLRHPHIATLQAVFQQPGDSPVAYLQLAFYEGGDLSQWLEVQAPDMPRRKTVLQQLAQALQHMHAHGAAHGDIKLENVLISAQARPRPRHAAPHARVRGYDEMPFAPPSPHCPACLPMCGRELPTSLTLSSAARSSRGVAPRASA